MEYNDFKYVAKSLMNSSDKSRKAYALNIDLMDFTDSLNSAIEILIKEIYGKDGLDWFSWFCYESDYGRRKWNGEGIPIYRKENGKLIKSESPPSKYGAFDSEGNPICYSIRSTWEYLEKNYYKNK